MSNTTIGKRVCLKFSDIFDFLIHYKNSYKKDKKSQWEQFCLLCNSFLFYKSESFSITADTRCYLDERIQVDGNEELIYPKFAEKHGLRFFCSGELVNSVVNILEGHVNRPTTEQFIDSLNYFLEHDSFLAIGQPFPVFIKEYDGCKISLTNTKSHTLVDKPGDGAFIIAPESSTKKADFFVDADQAINWEAFSPFASHPSGFWPNCIDYSGADSGFFEWSRHRAIYDMHWKPLLYEDHQIDASAARISYLTIDNSQSSGSLHLILPKPDSSGLCSLSLEGDLSRLSFSGDVSKELVLNLTPATARRSDGAPYHLPDLGVLRQVNHLNIDHNPISQPISLRCIEYFPNLHTLSISGSFCDFEYLTRASRLKYLSVRYAPNLNAFPDLAELSQLDYFLAWNVEETQGKLLRKQFKARASVRPWDEYSSVSQLRKAQWWEKEYGHPFAQWRGKLKKIGCSAYAEAQDALKKANNAGEVKLAFIAFSAAFNNKKGIETGEREDIGEAVFKLASLPAVARLGISETQALEWFDDARDY